MTAIEAILEGLMSRYKSRVPDVQAIIHCMMEENIISSGNEIENDHIAFRTMGVPHLGIQSLEKIFLHHGYQKMGAYRFPEKKLDAYWYAPPAENFPRIFISELRVSDLSENTQRIIHQYTDEVTSDRVDALNLDDAAAVDKFLHSGLWSIPTLSDFNTLSTESEYAAWVIYNRYYLNHFTISVHNLKPGYNTIQEFNAFLEKNGFVLNDSGGKYKKSPDGLLLQSSTVARMIEAEFADGERQEISGSYVEFAERKVLPEFATLPAAQLKRQHRREGFEAQNADKIFESTYAEQTMKHTRN
ncbi:MAG: DUF1338 domain-containing protein [Agriterribacter sp.]